MKKLKQIANLITILLVSSALVGCNNTGNTSANENDVYMSQFGEYEGSNNSVSNGNPSDNTNSNAVSTMTSNGEKMFEDTMLGNAFPNETDVTYNNNKASTKAKTDNTLSTASQAVSFANDSAQQQPSTTTVAQAVANPTENNSDSSSSSDTGSGVSQTCDDDSSPNVSNEDSSNTISAIFE